VYYAAAGLASTQSEPFPQPYVVEVAVRNQRLRLPAPALFPEGQIQRLGGRGKNLSIHPGYSVDQNRLEHRDPDEFADPERDLRP